MLLGFCTPAARSRSACPAGRAPRAAATVLATAAVAQASAVAGDSHCRACSAAPDARPSIIDADGLRVGTAHAYTARMCAASRWQESQRPDSLFDDPLSHALAGREGRKMPMGAWIMVPRTRYGDDLVEDWYFRKNCRQVVLLGAGMDARAFRMRLPELRVFEVDQPTLFDVKEKVLEQQASSELAVGSRHVVPADFSQPSHWARQLESMPHFRKEEPTVWLLEGLVMYLTDEQAELLMHDVGRLSGPGSVVFHDAISASYVHANIVVGGARFLSGSDAYVQLWSRHAGFASKNSVVLDFERAVQVDRARRRLQVSTNMAAQATPNRCRGKAVVLFVQVEKD